MRCAALLRTSTEEQTLGLAAQRATIEAWAKANGHTVESWHEEQVSGSAPLEERHGLAAALIALKAMGKGSALIVANRTRLARETALAAAIEGVVARAKCHVLSADGLPAGDDPTSRLMRGLMDLMSQFEVGLIRARTTAALAVRRAAGLRVTRHAKFGHRFDGDRMVPNPPEQRTLAAIHALRAEGLSAAKIAARLAAEGHVGRTGQPLALVTVTRALRAPPAVTSLTA